MENIYPCKTNQAPTYCHVTGAGAEPDTVGAVDVLRHVGEVGEHRHGGKMDQFHCRILNKYQHEWDLIQLFPIGYQGNGNGYGNYHGVYIAGFNLNLRCRILISTKKKEQILDILNHPLLT